MTVSTLPAVQDEQKDRTPVKTSRTLHTNPWVCSMFAPPSPLFPPSSLGIAGDCWGQQSALVPQQPATSSARFWRASPGRPVPAVAHAHFTHRKPGTSHDGARS